MANLKSVELTRLTAPERTELFRRLAAEGLFVARVGDGVKACGGVGNITTSPAPMVLLDGRAVAAVGSRIDVGRDAHGCPACPHACVGPVVTGVPSVLENGRPVAVAGSETSSTGCCRPAAGVIPKGSGPRELTSVELQNVARRLSRG